VSVEAIEKEVARALETGRDVRLHARDGEVMVARVLELSGGSVRFAVLTSSRPENHAVCDSTGAVRRLDELERAVVIEPRPRHR
jgi:hypothetical protein